MDKIYVKGIIQNILNKEFPNSVPKRKINEFNDRLNFACPICLDSSKNQYKKRGNLYLRNLYFICFNCGHKCSFDKLCRSNNIIIDPQKKLEMIEYLNSVVNYSDYESDFVDTKLDNLVNLNDLIDVFNVKNTTPIYDFKPIEKGGGIYKYLVGRGIPENLHKNIYQAKFSKGDEGFEHIIVFLNRKDDKVLGMQIRNLKEGRRRFFLIYNWENVYKFVHGEDVDLDVNSTIIYNKLSAFFNILNVDFSNTITVFEGFIDSLFYPNSIGLCGVNSDVKFLENNNLDLQYFFDNDISGFKKSEEKLNDGYKIFLWIKLFEDIVSKKKNDDPYKLYNRISKVKDLNKLNELVPNAFLKLKLSNFFSQDKFDVKYIPKEKKKKFEKDYNKKFKYNDF